MMSTLLVSKVAKTFERIGVATKERGACAECLITLERRGSRMTQKQFMSDSALPERMIWRVCCATFNLFHLRLNCRPNVRQLCNT